MINLWCCLCLRTMEQDVCGIITVKSGRTLLKEQAALTDMLIVWMEQRLVNLYNDPAYRKVVAALKDELFRLKNAVGDSDQFYGCSDYYLNPGNDYPNVFE